jgi:4-hydroxy-4-methyl-2-oxoglutarate aldolase
MTVSKTIFDKLKTLDTCMASNAIERLNVRLRNEGFVAGAVRCRFPNFNPMLGYAVTGRIRSSSPPMSGRCYYDRMDFWKYVTELPEPQVIVLEDVDHRPGLGAFFGEIHASIALALNCIGYVTNGAVRDLPAVKELGFHLFSGSVSVSHSYAHLVDFGDPVNIGGLKISPGDLLHGDCHGVQAIPFEIAAQIPEAAEKIKRSESELKEFCRSGQFSLDGLAKRLKGTALDCQ